MKVQIITYFLIFLFILFVHADTLPKRASGFDRLRDRIHRKRHRQNVASILNETDELYEFSIGEESQIRLAAVASTRAPLTTRSTVVVKHHHKNNKKKTHRREKNEELCKSRRKTVELNTNRHEFDPPFIVEVRCLTTRGIFGVAKPDQTCVKGMLRCVQQYSDMHVSRRSVDSVHWHPHTIPDVPISCQCMWPVDKYGHQDL